MFKGKNAGRVPVPARVIHPCRKCRAANLPEAAVSDVVGSILLVAITVIMSVVMAGLLLAFKGPVASPQVNLSVSVNPGTSAWGTGDEQIVVSHVGGDAIDGAAVFINYKINAGATVTVPGTSSTPCASQTVPKTVMCSLYTGATALPLQTKWTIGETYILTLTLASSDTVVVNVVGTGSTSSLLATARMIPSQVAAGSSCPFDSTGPVATYSGAGLGQAPANLMTSTVPSPSTVTVTAAVVDDCAGVDDTSAANKPHLWWAWQTSGVYADVGAMTYVSGTTWTGTIPQQTWALHGGDTLLYKIIAKDLRGTSATTQGPSDFIDIITSYSYVATNTATTGTVTNFNNACCSAAAGTDAGAAATLSEAGTPGTPSGSTRFGSTQTNSGATSPTNVFASDGAWATLPLDTNWVQAAGITPPGGAATLSAITIGMRAHDTLSAGVSLKETISGTATSASTTVATSAAITPVAGNYYLAAVANGNAAPKTVGSVSGAGLTWALAAGGALTNSAATGRTEVWAGTGTPSCAVTCTITATWSGGASASRAAIVVSRYAGVDLAAPVQAIGTAEAVGAGTASPFTLSPGALVGTNPTGRFYTAVDFVSASTVTYSTPATTVVQASTTNVRLAVGDGAALASGNTGAGSWTGGGTPDWVGIQLTLKPATAHPQVKLSYTVTGCGTCTTTLTQTLTGSDVDYTMNVLADRSWTPADLSNLAIRVDALGLSGGSALIDSVYATVTTTPATTYAMNLGLNWAGTNVGTLQTIDLSYTTPLGETYNVQVCQDALPTCAAWTTRAPIMQNLGTPYTYLMLANEFNAGSPRIRIIDATPAGTTQGVITLDYARVDLV